MTEMSDLCSLRKPQLFKMKMVMFVSPTEVLHFAMYQRVFQKETNPRIPDFFALKNCNTTA